MADAPLMAGKSVLVTGGTGGIGKATAIGLAALGARVGITGRDPARTEAAAAGIRAAAGSPAIDAFAADLSVQAGVRRLAAQVLETYPRLDVLVNNAGGFWAHRHVTADGLEHTFALNHLAPFLLTHLLRDRLDGGRVVTTASDAHQSGRLALDDLQSERSYSAMRVYGTSKLCNILFTRQLAARAPELRANCFHPGVVRTGFGKNEMGMWKVLTTVAGPFFRTPARGARSLVWLARSDEAAGLTGDYVVDEKVQAPSAQARDDDLAAGLWERSAELVGLAADAPTGGTA